MESAEPQGHLRAKELKGEDYRAQGCRVFERVAARYASLGGIVLSPQRLLRRRGRYGGEMAHAPTIGITFERGFDGGRLFVSNSHQGVRGASGPKNSSRIMELDPTTGALTELIIGLPAGDRATEQLTVRDGFLV